MKKEDVRKEFLKLIYSPFDNDRSKFRFAVRKVIEGYHMSADMRGEFQMLETFIERSGMDVVKTFMLEILIKHFDLDAEEVKPYREKAKELVLSAVKEEEGIPPMEKMFRKLEKKKGRPKKKIANKEKKKTGENVYSFETQEEAADMAEVFIEEGKEVEITEDKGKFLVVVKNKKKDEK